MHSDLGQFDIGKYRQLVSAASPGTVLALHDSDGRPVNDSGPADPDGRIEWPLHDLHGDVLGAVVSHGATPPEALMTAVVHCIESEIALVLELDQMAGELDERYDQLNLVFNTQRRSEDHHRDGPLESLAHSCIDHMGVDACIVAFPELDIFICTGVTEQKRLQVANLTTVLCGAVSARLAADDPFLILNTAAERIEARLPIADKLIANRVGAMHGGLSGMLLVLRDPQHEDFTNSDRNVVNVLGNNAYKIVAASYDVMTGLLNQQAFDLELHRGISIVAGASLLLLDIDHMQVINDQFGHEVGDKVIKATAEFLRDNLRRSDHAGYISGNRFGVLLDNCSLPQALQIGDKLRCKIADLPWRYDGQRCHVSVSVGVAHLGAGIGSSTAAHDRVELALRDAKERGGNRVIAFNDDNQELAQRKQDMNWLIRIQEALENDQFELFAQVIAETANPEKIHHYEILLRLRDADGSIIAPFGFLPAAERFQMMPAIDLWVMRHTCQYMEANWPALQQQGVALAINLSGQSIGDHRFREQLMAILAKTSIPMSHIGFEITETTAVSNLRKASEFIDSLRGLGCAVYLDDFGTGLASFDYLKRLSINAVKIDGIFIKDLTHDKVSQAMVKAISEVAQIMHIRTVAEFVEDDAIRLRLQELGIDYVQGYGIGKPGPIDDVIALPSPLRVVQ